MMKRNILRIVIIILIMMMGNATSQAIKKRIVRNLQYDLSVINRTYVNEGFGEEIRLSSPGASVILDHNGFNVFGDWEYEFLPMNAKNVRVKLIGKHFAKRIKFDAPLERDRLIPAGVEDDDSSSPNPGAIKLHFPKKIPDCLRMYGPYKADGEVEYRIDIEIMDYDPDTYITDLYDQISYELTYEDDTTDVADNKTYGIERSTRIAHTDMAAADICDERPRYIIITTAELKESCGQLASWKRQKGYEVICTSIEEILMNPKFSLERVDIHDTAESVREYLKYIFDGRETYCLFVGDVSNRLPIRYFYDKGKGERITDDDNDLYSNNFIPSDLYFSDLTNNWTLESDVENTYTIRAHGFSYTPAIYVGRLMCTTSDELDNYLYKLKLYEAFPGRGDVEYLDKGLLFQQNQMVNKKNLFDSQNGIDLKDITVFQDNAPTIFSQNVPTGGDIISAMRRCGIASWQGHGVPYNVACSGAKGDQSNWRYIKPPLETCHSPFNPNEKNNSLDMIDNIDYPSIVYSISCDIMPFDVMWHQKIPYNMGSGFTVAGKYGGVALLGNTRLGYMGQSNSQEVAFASQVKQYRKIGKAHTKMLEQCGGSSYVGVSHNLMGDPELEMWLGAPLEMSIIPMNFRSGLISFAGDDLTDAMISIYDGEGANYVFTPSSTYFTSMIPSPSAECNFDVNCFMYSVWKSGYLPKLEFYGQDYTLRNKKKSFSVKNATIGRNVTSVKFPGDFVIGANSELNISSLDKLSIYDGTVISKDGVANLQCDGDVTVTGLKVEAGGTLNLSGKEIEIGVGFVVDAGAEVQIN